MVRPYTDTELLNRVKTLPGFTVIPKYLLIGVRSKEDRFNEFDDKFYLYIDGKFIVASTGTTNPGSNSLLGGWKRLGVKGAAVIKSDEIYYDVYKFGLHKGKMPALRQVKPMKYYRDGDNDKQAEEIGEMTVSINYTNFHFNSYNIADTIKKTFIGGWSEGCQVSNDRSAYYRIIEYCKTAPAVTYALLKEF